MARGFSKALVLAFGTSSSSAALPVSFCQTLKDSVSHHTEHVLLILSRDRCCCCCWRYQSQ